MNKLIMIFLLLYSRLSFADGADIDVEYYKNKVNDSVGKYVTDIVNNTSAAGAGAQQLHLFANALVSAAVFLALAWGVYKYVTRPKEYDAWTFFSDFLVIVFMLALWGTYDSATKFFWGISDALGIVFISSVTGNSDVSFIYNLLLKSISNVYVDEGFSLTSFGSAVIWNLVFAIISFILKAVIFIISLWTIWGYAFCKLLGIIMFPLWFVPITRPYFSKWVELFISFWLFNFFSKIALSIFYIYFESTIGFLSTPLELDAAEDIISLRLYTLHMVIGIFFILSAGKLANSIASGSGEAGRSAAKAAGTAVKAIKGFF